MSARGGTSEHFAPLFEKAGAIVIDNSSQWRMAEDIDLIVPEVNEPTFTKRYHCQSKLLYDSICCTSKSIARCLWFKTVAYTTYQAVSGSGMKGKKDLAEGVNGKAPEAYPHQFIIMCYRILMCFRNGYTKEQKMIDETRKILNAPDLKVTATCARVPVQDSHSVEIDVTLDKRNRQKILKRYLIKMTALF